jgi:hypothetical protein
VTACGTAQASNGVSGPSSPSIDTRILGLVSIFNRAALNSRTASWRDECLSMLAA